MIRSHLAAFDLSLLGMTADQVPMKLRLAYHLLLLVCGTLLVVFVLTVLLVRTLRRYRQTLLSDPRKPTPNEDLWSQHRLPEEPPQDKPGDEVSPE